MLGGEEEPEGVARGSEEREEGDAPANEVHVRGEVVVHVGGALPHYDVNPEQNLPRNFLKSGFSKSTSSSILIFRIANRIPILLL